MTLCIKGFRLPQRLSNKESACRAAGDAGSVPGSGRAPGGEYGNPLQCSFLESHRQIVVSGAIYRLKDVRIPGSTVYGKHFLSSFLSSSASVKEHLLGNSVFFRLVHGEHLSI